MKSIYKILCYAAYGLYEVVMMSPAGPDPFSEEQQKNVKARYEKIKPICEEKKKKDPTFDWMTPPNNGSSKPTTPIFPYRQFP
ncbi:MAG: hypothetical protein R2877_06750 [Bdellovibrionota bacterium]